MTGQEIAIFRQMLTDVLSTQTAEIKGELEIMKHDIVHIKEQTFKTNGRVNRHDTAITDLEKADLKHSANCPLEARLKLVEADVSSRKSVWNFLVIAAGAIVSFALVTIAVMEYLNKL